MYHPPNEKINARQAVFDLNISNFSSNPTPNLRIPSSVLVLDALLRALLVSAEPPRFKPLRQCVACPLEKHGMPGLGFKEKQEVLFGGMCFFGFWVPFSCVKQSVGGFFGDDKLEKQHRKLREHHRNNF